MEPLALSGTYRIVAAILFGVALGFILIRSELAWRKTFLDQLSMRNSQFFKTLFTSIAVGIILFYFLKRFGIVHYNIRPTYFWGSALGGMICAAGVVFCGQVPSTAVAAIGAGRIYAIWVFAGMMMALPFVQYISKSISGTIYTWPKPANYNDRLDQFFSGDSLFLWFAGASIILCLFFEFIQSDRKSGGKKGDSE
ncbi:MAG: YeeE/YedE thiosulfate transporter family protein [Victivallales bacterium]